MAPCLAAQHLCREQVSAMVHWKPGSVTAAARQHKREETEQNMFNSPFSPTQEVLEVTLGLGIILPNLAVRGLH